MDIRPGFGYSIGTGISFANQYKEEHRVEEKKKTFPDPLPEDEELESVSGGERAPVSRNFKTCKTEGCGRIALGPSGLCPLCEQKEREELAKRYGGTVR